MRFLIRGKLLARAATRSRAAPGPAVAAGPRVKVGAMEAIRSVGLFIAAGLAEIGGGYLVWRWLREGAPWPVGVAGAGTLVVYGVIPTLPATSAFGRASAPHGGGF